MPVEDEKRAVIGVEAALKWWALVSLLAAEVGVNVPVRRWPRAWAVRGKLVY